jgi:hypothetical protein
VTVLERERASAGAQAGPAGDFGPDIESVLDELDRELIALEPVKTRIREVSALLVIDRLR